MFRQCQSLVELGSLGSLRKCVVSPSHGFSQSFKVWPARPFNRKPIHQSARLSSTGIPWSPQVPSLGDLKHLNLKDIHPKHRELLEADRSSLHYYDRVTLRRLIEWLESGPPPITQYRLTFGKHKGKLLEEVPDSYMVKYLIPRHKDSMDMGHCAIVGVAVEDFMKRHPEVKSQAGNTKTKPVEGAVLKSPIVEKKERGRPPGKAAKKSTVPKHVIEGIPAELRLRRGAKK
ncbi:hypothetical protein HBH98_074900 [Parastagonospora nodorum]|nr:hypothetical protein HBH53_167030 [Parastagonospora nodorum]KAH3977447.1 hypothetical protein HBH52_111520 [Parastagonospora nodorum]KAH4199536.1 hypothetical protein HBI95_174680 [Parastagonospora nodorum]KAH4303254.1 hypothetical protein HBI01_082230 [Parastagonospora nodorum]KAH4318878.1 hypothetical protein HBI02_004940 [Parastagonospora nodorum]